MNTEQENEREERLLARLKSAQLGLTEEELQFFPRVHSMPDPPRSKWTQSEELGESFADEIPDEGQQFSFWCQ